MPRASLIALAAALLLAPVPAFAECTISVTSVAFGAYTTTSSTPLDGTGTVRLDCRHNDDPVVTIATGSSGTYAARRMVNGTSQLQYNLYTTAARLTVWGNGTGGTASVVPPITQSSGLRRIRESAIYGRIPAAQNVRAGSYTDTMFVTVSF
jgi:spore coat protein U-like protein